MSGNIIAKLTISKNSDPDWHVERDFGQEVITIGRDNSNTLLLEDGKKIVSRQHAKIQFIDGDYHLIDCGSRNFTFLNDRKITPNKPCLLRSGDQVRISEYILRYTSIQAAPESQAYQEETALLENPFGEDMQIIANLLSKIKRKYDVHDPAMRDATLRTAFHEMMTGVDIGSVGEIIGRELVPQNGFAADVLQSEPIMVPPEPAEEQPASESQVAYTGQDPSEMMMPADTSTMLRIGQTLDMLAGSMISIVRSSENFRNNFLGMPVSRLASSIHVMTVEEFKEFLFTSSIAEEEAQNRFQLVRQQVDDSLQQYQALLDVYKTDLNDGMLHMLESLNPDKLMREYAQHSGFMKVIPGYVNSRVNQFLQTKLRELLAEQRDNDDHDSFRPLFVNTYMEKLSQHAAVADYEEY